jgi:hypothetical protein
MMEEDAPAELDGIEQAIIAHRLSLSQHRNRAPVEVCRVQAFERVRGDVMGDGRRRPMSIQGRRFSGECHGQGAPWARRPPRPSQGHAQPKQEQDDEATQHGW